MNREQHGRGLQATTTRDLAAGATRRTALKAFGAAAVGSSLGALPARLLAAAEREQVAGHHPQWLPSAEQLGAWLQRLHDFGPIRATGTRQCRAFEEFLAGEFEALGCVIERDQHRLTSWECDVERDCSIVVREANGATRDLEVLACYPFCGSTRDRGAISGPVLYAPGAPDRAAADELIATADPARLAESIVVLDVPFGWASLDRIELYPETFGASPTDRLGGPPPLGTGGSGLVGLMQEKCKGLVLCYTDVSDDAARYNYKPFSEPHGRIPALWVGAESSRYLQSVSGEATLTMRCDAKLQPDARADSIVATLPSRTDEVIFLTTHTDGPNEVNDNGALALLALATYASRIPATERQAHHRIQPAHRPLRDRRHRRSGDWLGEARRHPGRSEPASRAPRAHRGPARAGADGRHGVGRPRRQVRADR